MRHTQERATAERGADPAAIVETLYVQRSDELGELFACLPLPAPGELRGAYRGRLLGISALDRVPRRLGRWLYGIGMAVNPWRGKAFASTSGENRWGTVAGPAFGRFRVEQRPSPVDGRAVLWLDYDVAGNPGIVRRVRAELRRLGEDVFLARMLLQRGADLRHLAYFVLTPGPDR